jgi:hypothetical protein
METSGRFLFRIIFLIMINRSNKFHRRTVLDFIDCLEKLKLHGWHLRYFTDQETRWVRSEKWIGLLAQRQSSMSVDPVVTGSNPVEVV